MKHRCELRFRLHQLSCIPFVLAGLFLLGHNAAVSEHGRRGREIVLSCSICCSN